MAHSAPYVDRRTWLIEIGEISKVTFKIYGMVGKGKEILPSSVERAKSFVESNVDFGDRAKFGFVVMHHGEESMWLLVDWWVEDILHQKLFNAPIDNVEDFQDATIGHELACVWELLVTCHERDAWVKHIMLDPQNADFAAYLEDTLSIQ